jgi:hypothetical protein
MIGFATALSLEIGGSSDCHPDLLCLRWSDFTCSAPGNGSMNVVAEPRVSAGGREPRLLEWKVETLRGERRGAR